MLSDSNRADYPRAGPVGSASGSNALVWQGEHLLIAAWWISVISAGASIIVFSHRFLPAKYSYDAALIHSLLQSRDLWAGVSFDGYVNTARVWSIVFSVVPPAVFPPVYYCLMAVLAVRLLGVLDVHQARYHLMAGVWIVASALFLSLPNKDVIALPVALWLCVARSRSAQLLAMVVFLCFAVFIRQYWVICYFYFVCALIALRLQIANRPLLALALMLVAYVLPFALPQVFDLEPLTQARTLVNAERIDDPDARSAFNNTFNNTGFLTDVGNAVFAWPYMFVPVALLANTSPLYVLFAAFQIVSLWFFIAGCAAFVKDARRIRHAGSVYLRCAAFVIAYSLTLSIFEPDFGSFLRHEVVFMIPMLIVVFYRAHAYRGEETQQMRLAYGRNVSA